MSNPRYKIDELVLFYIDYGQYAKTRFVIRSSKIVDIKEFNNDWWYTFEKEYKTTFTKVESELFPTLDHVKEHLYTLIEKEIKELEKTIVFVENLRVNNVLDTIL